MSLNNAMNHTGGPYPDNILAALSELATRDGLPAEADLEALAKKAWGVRLSRFTYEGVLIEGERYFKNKWCLVGSDEDGAFATDVPMKRG